MYDRVGPIEWTNIDFHLVISTFYHKNIYIDDIQLYRGGGGVQNEEKHQFMSKLALFVKIPVSQKKI